MREIAEQSGRVTLGQSLESVLHEGHRGTRVFGLIAVVRDELPRI